MEAKSTKGFTVLEVIIVIVIAAIILVIVFIAVPQFRLTQRNNKRAADARRVLVSTFQFLKQSGTNVTNTTPANCLPASSCFMPTWLNANEYAPPGGGSYRISVSGTLTALPAGTLYDVITEIAIARQRLCNGNVLNSTTGTSGAYAVIIRLENITGGAGDTYCIDSRSVE